MKKGKCCGTCKYNGYDAEYKTFYCKDEESENYMEQTFYDTYCGEWEAKHED